MVYPNEYIVKFYDGFKLMREEMVYANSLKEAVKNAMDSAQGMFSFDKIKIKFIDGSRY